MDDYNNDQDNGNFSKLRDYLSKGIGSAVSKLDQDTKNKIGSASQYLTGEGNQGRIQDQPLEGYGAIAKGMNPAPKTAGVTPEGSPIDLVAGGLGAKAGPAFLKANAGIVGNEIGSFGADISKFAPIPEGSRGLVEKFRDMMSTIGREGLSGQEMLDAARQINQNAIEKGMQSPVSMDMLEAIKQKATRERALQSMKGQ